MTHLLNFVLEEISKVEKHLIKSKMCVRWILVILYTNLFSSDASQSPSAGAKAVKRQGAENV